MLQINFKERGSGTSVILIHGFPMDQSIWDDFASDLAAYGQVFTPDLPGFGDSQSIPAPFSLERIADALLEWISAKAIQNSYLIGHSLGGYVALAMAAKAPALFKGLGLFHSTAYADTDEKKESRTKVLKFVDEKGVLTFTSNFIQPLFADPDHPAVFRVKASASKASAEAVKGYTLAMRDRPDNTNVLKAFPGKVLFIAGAHDPGIPVETVKEQASLRKDAQLHILENAAHMGMFESPEETLTVVRSFIS